MSPILKFLSRRAEDVQVALMVAMFVAFIVQIGSRYVFNAPVDWAYEVILITWLWAVFWGAAFLIADKEHVKFDVIYNMGSVGTRRIYALISAVVLMVGFAVSMPATWDFISFKKIRSSDILGIRFDILFSVYLVFLVAMIVHYGLRCWRLIRGDSLSTLEREESP
jgi:TRAP-type C4-dicarboxylate transport system permease small subunit